jgi:GxxExxY protein
MLMNTDGNAEMGDGKLLFAADTEVIIGAAMEVLNVLGHGLLEKPYENALAVEFRLRGIEFEQQPQFDVMYKEVIVGLYVPDLIVRGNIVVDTKTIDKIGDHEKGQMLNYLGLTGLRVGLILNFKRANLNGKELSYEFIRVDPCASVVQNNPRVKWRK